jgi:hypothetical protein
VTTPSDPAGTRPDPKKAPPLQLGLPAIDAGASTEEERSLGGVEHRPTHYVRVLRRFLGVLVILAAVAAPAVVWGLPWYVRRQCIDEAAAHGIDLSVDEAKIDAEGFRFIGVQATLAGIPGAHAQAPQVDVETSALRPRKMTVRGAVLVLDGRWNAVDSQVAKWRASPSGGQGGDWAPASLIVDDARIVWRAPIGDNVRIEASGLHAEVVWREHVELHARSDRVVAVVPGETLGPWRVDIDRVPGSSRVRIALDPGVPEACTVLIVGDGERTASVDIVVPRSPLGHLGVPAHLFASNGPELQVATTLHYVALGPARADASAQGGAYGLEVLGLPRPIDVAWEAAVTGDATAGIDIKRARLAVGPLVGPVTGTLRAFEDGFRVDLAWAAGPVPCAALVTPLGLGQPFDIGYLLRKLVAAPGTSILEGDVSATAMLSFDSRDLGATKLDFTPEIQCRNGKHP